MPGNFFFIGPGARNNESGVNCTLVIVASHYRKSVQAAFQLLETLRQKLRDSNIDFTDKGPDTAELSFGINSWNKGQMQLSLAVTLKVPYDEVIAVLRQAGFSQGHPDSQ